MAMLNLLPKLELVPMSRYFITLPKAFRPSRMPVCRTRRLRSRRMISAASLATSTALATEIPTSAAVKGRRIVDTVAQKADDVAPMFEGKDDAVLLCRRNPGKDRSLLGNMAQGRIGHSLNLFAQDDAFYVQADLGSDVPASIWNCTAPLGLPKVELAADTVAVKVTACP